MTFTINRGLLSFGDRKERIQKLHESNVLLVMGKEFLDGGDNSFLRYAARCAIHAYVERECFDMAFFCPRSFNLCTFEITFHFRSMVKQCDALKETLKQEKVLYEQLQAIICGYITDLYSWDFSYFIQQCVWRHEGLEIIGRLGNFYRMSRGEPFAVRNLKAKIKFYEMHLGHRRLEWIDDPRDSVSYEGSLYESLTDPYSDNEEEIPDFDNL